jgi:hypothetical protein
MIYFYFKSEFYELFLGDSFKFITFFIEESIFTY